MRYKPKNVNTPDMKINSSWYFKMVEELDLNEWDKVAQLFASHILTKSVIHPCVHAGIGSITVDNTDTPIVAMYNTPLMNFGAGSVDSPSAQEMVKSVPPYVIFTSNDDGWKNLLKSEWDEKFVTETRTHLDHSTLNLSHLRNLKGKLESEYTLRELHFEAVSQIKEDYSIPIRLYFGSLKGLVERGIGFCVMEEEKLVSVAYTPFPYVDDFEIQVYTDDSLKYRRKGLGTVVSAALIEYGLENGLTPHWDAANETSVKLALKLGYTNPTEWEVYYHKSE